MTDHKTTCAIVTDGHAVCDCGAVPLKVPFELIEQLAQKLAGVIDQSLPDGWQFILHVLQTGPEGLLTYVANVERDDAIRVVQEWLQHQDTHEFDSTDITPSCSCCGLSIEASGYKFTGRHRTVRLCLTCVNTVEKMK